MFTALHKYSAAGLLLLRLAIGAVFLYHGLAKWQIADPNAMFNILKYAEPLGGIALILGVLTELAALGLGIIMVGAIYMKMTAFGTAALNAAGTFAPQGATGWEFDMVLLAGCIILLTMGAGKYSLDSMISKK